MSQTKDESVKFIEAIIKEQQELVESENKEAMHDYDVSSLSVISKCKISIALGVPFFSQLLFYLKIRPCWKTSTFAISPTTIYYNPVLATKSSKEEVNFILMHEVYHNMLMHNMERAGGRNVMTVQVDPVTKEPIKGAAPYPLYYIAADYVINWMIQSYIDESGKSQLFSRPGYCLYDNRFANMCTEEVYDILLKEMEENGQTSSFGCYGKDKNGNYKVSAGTGMADDHSKLDGEGNENDSFEWVQRTQQAIMREEMNNSSYGKKSLGEALSLLKSIVFEPPKVDWRAFIQQRVSQHFVFDKTFIPPNKRLMHMGYVFPSVTGKYVRGVLCLDTSGSMVDDDTLSNILKEFEGIMNQFNNYKLDVLSCDTEITNHEIFEHGRRISDYEENIKNIAKGGGGTDFRPFFEYLKENIHDQLDFIVIGTDGYGSFPDIEDVPSRVDVIWLDITNNVKYQDRYPFGTVVQI